MKETDFAAKVIEYFNDEQHEVYPEVPCAGIIDIVVKSGPVIIAVECKLNFGFDVIQQAFKNRNYAHYSYIAVPKDRQGFPKKICQDYGIGILSFYRDEHVVETLKPKLNRKIIKPKLHDWMKLSTAGSQNDRMTSWKYWKDDVIRILTRRGSLGLEPKQLFETGYRHYAKVEYMKRNLITYIKSGLVANAEFRDGKFFYKP